MSAWIRNSYRMWQIVNVEYFRNVFVGWVRWPYKAEKCLHTSWETVWTMLPLSQGTTKVHTYVQHSGSTSSSATGACRTWPFRLHMPTMCWRCEEAHGWGIIHPCMEKDAQGETELYSCKLFKWRSKGNCSYTKLGNLWSFWMLYTRGWLCDFMWVTLYTIV